MNVAQVFNRLINGPSPNGLAGALGLAAIMVIAGLLLSLGGRRWIARILISLGLILMMATLLAVREQSITEQQTDVVHSRRPRYSARMRLYAGSALLAVPAVTAVAAFTVFMTRRRGRRAEVPRHLKAGRKHVIQKDYDAALQAYNRAIHVAPHMGEAYYRRGGVYHAMGQPALALADFDRALDHDPRLAAAYLERGKIRTELGDLDGALADFGQLMRIRANDPDFYLNRGICLMKKGLPHDAAADFQRVLKLTNHSDFAEPAKVFLAQCEPHNSSTGMPASPDNQPTDPHTSRPAPQDYIV